MQPGADALRGADVNGRPPYDNRFYREWMMARGAHDALALLAFKTAQRFGGVAMTRSAPLPPFGADDKHRISLLGPHIRRALTISDLVGQCATARDRFKTVIDSLAAPVVIVDPAGVIGHANAAARGLMAASTAVSSDTGILRAAEPEAREALKQAIAEGCAGRSATVALGAGAAPGLIATILPLDAPAAVAVFFHRAAEAGLLPGEAFARLYKLTGTELRIVMLLTEGADVADIAARLGSAAETVRWHLKNLRAKTGCARISDLVLLAARAASPVLP